MSDIKWRNDGSGLGDADYLPDGVVMHDMVNSLPVKGAKAGQKAPRKPNISKDTAASISTAKLLYGLAEGEIYGLADGAKSIRLDGTPLVDDAGNPNFEGVTWDFRNGSNDQEYIKGFPDVSNETPVNVELRSSQPWIKAFNDTQISAVRVRFKWNRLSETNGENGDVKGYKIDYAIDLQTDGGAYQTVLTTKIQDKTSAGYERTHRIDLPKAKTGWQLRVRRITPNSTSDLIQDTMMIDAVAEVIDVKLSYPNTALLGVQYNAELFSNIAKMSVRLKGKIIRVPDNYDPVARTYTGIWTGNFKDAYSNNPAWIFYDLCTQWRGGLGERLDATMIDRWSLYALGQYCDQPVSDGQGGLEPRFTCNVYLQKQEEAYTVLQNIAGIFRAMSFWTGERIMLDADVPQDSIYTYSSANIVGGVAGIQYSGTRNRDRHTLAKVAWDNPNNDYQTEYEYIRDEKAMSKFGVKVLDLSAFGCTSQAQAQRAGLWALKTEQLETRQVTFSVGLDGAIPRVGNIISLSDEAFAGRANGGRVSTVNSTQRIIELDREVTASVGDVLIINGGSGKSERRNISNVVGNRITVTAGFTSAEPQHVWAIETADLKLMRFRVMSITENDDATYAITAIQHEPQKYDAIDFGTDVKPTEITIINPDTVDAPASVTVTSRHREVQGQTVTTLIISWSQVSGAVAYDAEWRKDDGTWVRVPRTGNVSVEIDGVYSGNYMARVRAISAFDVQSRPTSSMLTEVKGKIGLPPTIVGLTATGILFGMDLKWGFAAGSGDAAYTEIQVGSAPDVNVATLTQVSYPTNTHTVTGLQGNLKQSYRARLVDKLGFKSPWSAWVTGTTDASADKIMDLIQGQIDESSLNQILTSKIADIKINKDAISKETQDRIQAIIDLNKLTEKAVADVDVEYYLSSSATTPTGGEWLTKAPAWQQSKFMFSRTKTTLADGTVSYTPSVNGTNITGAKGDKGEQGVAGKDGYTPVKGVDYFDGIKGTDGSDGDSAYQSWLKSGNTGTTTDFINYLRGQDGKDGKDGIAGAKGADGVTYYTWVKYADSPDGTIGFSNNPNNKPYIGFAFNKTEETESTNPSDYTWSLIKGEQGVTGDKGNTGQGVESIVEQYGISKIKSQAPTTWTETVPEWSKGDYVWTRSKITYKDPVRVEYTTPIIDPAWDAISVTNTSFVNFKEKTESDFHTQGELLDGIISDYRPEYFDKTKYFSSVAEQWTYAKTVAASNYAANERITNLQSEFANSNANVTQTLFTLTEQDKAIASDVSQLYAKTNENYGLIQDVSIAISTPNTGLAAKVTELQASAANAQSTADQAVRDAQSKSEQAKTDAIAAANQYAAAEAKAKADAALLAATGDATTKANAAKSAAEAAAALDAKNKADAALAAAKLDAAAKVKVAKDAADAAQGSADAAQQAANDAATAAGNKGEVIYSATTPSADKQKAQNLWIDTSGGKNTPKRWASGAWLTVTDKAATDAQAAADKANTSLLPANLASLVQGSGAFSDEFGSISGKFANFEAVVEGQKTAMEVISGIGNAEKLKNEIAKARLDKNVTNLNAQSTALTTQINGYTTKITDVTAKRNATTDAALKAEYNKLITDLTDARTDLTAQKSVIADQVAQLAAEKKVLDDFKEVEDGVRAQHAIKIDSAGKIVGFGLVLQKDGFSAFDVRADRFSISAPSDKPNDVNGNSPFMVLTNPQNINGVQVPAGTYMRNFYAPRGSIDTLQVKDGAIKSAQIDDLAVTTGKIASLAVDTLQINNNAVTVPVAFSYPSAFYVPPATSPDDFKEVMSATLPTSLGKTIFTFSTSYVYRGTANGRNLVLRMLVDGEIYIDRLTMIQDSGSVLNFAGNFSFSRVITNTKDVEVKILIFNNNVQNGLDFYERYALGMTARR